MSRPLRMLDPSAIFLATVRCLQGRLFLRSSRETYDVLGGVLARAVRLYGVEIFAFNFASNHLHLIVRAPRGNLPQFMQYLLSNISKKVGPLVKWRGAFWERRYSAQPLLDDAALLDKVRYVLAHGVKEGLVRHCSEWPGCASVDAGRKAAHLPLVELDAALPQWPAISTWVSARRAVGRDRGAQARPASHPGLRASECRSPVPRRLRARDRTAGSSGLSDGDGRTARLCAATSAPAGATGALARALVPHDRPTSQRRVHGAVSLVCGRVSRSFGSMAPGQPECSLPGRSHSALPLAGSDGDCRRGLAERASASVHLHLEPDSCQQRSGVLRRRDGTGTLLVRMLRASRRLRAFSRMHFRALAR